MTSDTAEFSRVPEEDRLRERLLFLERENEELRKRKDSLEESSTRLKRFFECSNETMAIIDRSVIVEVNPRVLTMFGYSPQEAIGRSALDLIAPASRQLVGHNIRIGYEEPYEALALRKDGSIFLGEFRGRAIPYEGRSARITMVLDITERQRAEEAVRQAAIKEEVIRAQAAAIAQLSTPLLPVGDGILVLPLVGEISAERGARVLEALMRGVAEHRARTAIFDITGMTSVSAPAVELLVRAAHAVRLLGAEVQFTGIRPEVAQVLIDLDVDMAAVRTHATLKQGIAEALLARMGGQAAFQRVVRGANRRA
jgi:rsbT co-antagonist protein RsbR